MQWTWNFLIFNTFGAVQKDRNRRTCPEFRSGAKRELTQRITEKCIDFQLSRCKIGTGSAEKILHFLDSLYGRGCKKKKIKKLASGVNFQCIEWDKNRVVRLFSRCDDLTYLKSKL
jgi:hypothetical protein